MIVSSAAPASTLPDAIARHALATPARPALTFLIDGERSSTCLTYGELAARANTIAAELTRRSLAGRPVVLLYPAGPDYLCALLGCFSAGAIAVPAYPPTGRRLGRAAERIASLVADARAEVALTTNALLEVIGTTRELNGLTCLATDAWGSGDPCPRALAIDRDQPCLLQYTSGSTSAPKGVLLTHAQLCANLALIAAAGEHRIDGPIVTWLPPYHDMGLIGTLLFPLYSGNHIVQLSPESFVRKPVRWLRAISKYRAALTASPNFALDLCLRRIPLEERAGLDLSSLRLLCTGSEPISATSLEAFAKAFAPYGLRPDALAPCYGMAEATLILSAHVAPTQHHVRGYDADALEAGHARPSADGARARRLVGCGTAQPPGALRIVDPIRCCEVPRGSIGEIWAASPSLASGYWHRPHETNATFHARLADTDDGPFLRTGDLGFLDGDELFVTGRLKELIIVRGKKHFPQDIERTVQRLDPALIADAGAAFSHHGTGTERVCVLQEVDQRLDPDLDSLLERIREALREQHEITAHTIVLVKRSSVLRTSSGKIQRAAMKAAFLDDRMQAVARWDVFSAEDTASDPAPATSTDEAARQTHTRLVTAERRAAAIESFLREQISTRTKQAVDEIDRDAPLADYGVDSLIASEIAEALERWLGVPVPSTISYDHPTIRGLSNALAGLAPPARASPRKASQATIAAPAATGASDSIAIVGMACRFPGANDLQAFWRLLQTGGDAVGEIPKTRWDAAALYHAGQRPGSLASRAGGFVDDIEQFDPQFFGISIREASRMDPQQRLFLEVVWQALEDAGIAADSLAGSDTGVFAAVCGSDHALLHAGDLRRVDADFGSGHAASVVANRVSYFLDLQGPSVSYDSACSSALVALQAACQSLATGECQVAIVGGVNAVLAPHAGVFFSNMRALSSAGHCKSFDKHADGFVRSEGCGVIVLQRSADAEAQANRSYALVAGSAAAHGGATNGLMAPNGAAQEQVIRRALQRARLSPAALDYVEAHGVGARLADAVELRALGAVLQGAERHAPCWVGSVKTNLGHMEAAGGIASVIKTALALHHEEIPRNLHFTELQPELAQLQLPVAIPTQAVAWRRSQRPRHAGVSAFGLGGTNAHVILSEAPERRLAEAVPERPNHVLVLSARSPTALAQLCADWLRVLPEVPLPDACFTAAVGRKHFAQRAAFVGANHAEVCAALGAFKLVGPTVVPPSRPRTAAGIALLFRDDTAAIGSGRMLYATQPEFRRAADQAAGWLDSDTAELGFTGTGGRASGDDVTRVAVSGLVMQYALFELLRSWNVQAKAVCGVGSGEYLAACAAGVLDWQKGLWLALRQAQLLASLTPGANVVCTLRQFKTELTHIAHASAQLPLLLASREQVLAPDALLEPEHWLNQLYASEATLSAAGLRSLHVPNLLELGGPGFVAVQTLELEPEPIAQERSNADDGYAALLRAVAELYTRGVDIDWVAFEQPFARVKRSLPSYPFERTRCWLEPPVAAHVAPATPAASAHPLLQRMTLSSPLPEPNLPRKHTG